MTTTATDTSNFGDLVQDLVRMQAEEELRAKYFLTDPSIGAFIPGIWTKGTSSIIFPRYADLAAATTALTENANPTGQALSIDDESITGDEYGGIVEVGNRAQQYSPHNLIGIAAEKAGRQAALSLHSIVETVIYAGAANIVYTNGTTNSSLSTGMTGAALLAAVAKLQKTNVPTFGDGNYRALMTPEQIQALKGDTATGGWIDAMKYGDPSMLLRGEAGTYGGVRILNVGSLTGGITAAAGYTYASGTYAVHKAFLFGPQAYGVAGLETLKTTYVPPVASSNDPLGLVAKCGWHVFPYGAALLTKAGSRYATIHSAQVSIT
jgi:N4-gp56 family major capsid protein